MRLSLARRPIWTCPLLDKKVLQLLSIWRLEVGGQQSLLPGAYIVSHEVCCQRRSWPAC